MARTTDIDENVIQDQIQKIEGKLKNAVMNYQHISAKELIAYFDGPAPSGDTTTLFDIMENQWLFIHELVELSELKGMNLPISVDLLTTHALEVDYAHVTATEYELKLAKEGGDMKWIKSRLGGIKVWLDEDTMPPDLQKRCLALYETYSFLV